MRDERQAPWIYIFPRELQQRSISEALTSQLDRTPPVSHNRRSNHSTSFVGVPLHDIRKVAVLGAGTMGARIAAHLANAQIPSVLLDIVPSSLTPQEQSQGLTLDDLRVRNRFAHAG